MELRIDCAASWLGWSLLTQNDERFARYVAEWLRAPVPSRHQRRSQLSPNATTGLIMSTAAHHVGTRQRIVAASALREEKTNDNSTTAAATAALREQSACNEETLIECVTGVFRVLLFDEFALELRVSNAMSGAVGKSSTRLYLFSELESLGNICDTTLLENEHRTLAYLCALSPLSCKKHSQSSLFFSERVCSAFSALVERTGLVERVCRVILRRVPTRQFTQYQWLLDATLQSLYREALERPKFNATALLEVATRIRLAESESYSNKQ